jgi:hypothetical protein
MTMMKRADIKQRHCRRVTAAILLLGLGSALAVYLNAVEMPESPFSEYENSKRFSHEVQQVGGKLALVANDLSAWFDGLWQGRRLAWTLACMTMVIAAGYYLIAGSAAQEDQNDRPSD